MDEEICKRCEGTGVLISPDCPARFFLCPACNGIGIIKQEEVIEPVDVAKKKLFWACDGCHRKFFSMEGGMPIAMRVDEQGETLFIPGLVAADKISAPLVFMSFINPRSPVPYGIL